MGPAQGESIRAPPWHIEDMESSIAIICKKIFYLLPLINTVVVCGFIMVAYIIVSDIYIYIYIDILVAFMHI